MTQSGAPLDNAIAERINGILKNEYLLEKQVNNISEAKETLNQVVELYNNERPHLSIGNLCPEIVHQNNIKTEKLWKKYDKQKTKTDEENYK
jgi:transposase InsO family protein